MKQRIQAIVDRSRRWGDETGASLVEYALLVALIAVVCIGAVAYLGTSNGKQLDRAGKAISGSTHDGKICNEYGSGPGTVHHWDTANPGGGYIPDGAPEPGPCP